MGPTRGQGLGPRGDAVPYCLGIAVDSTLHASPGSWCFGDQRCPIAGGTGPFCVVLALTISPRIVSGPEFRRVGC